MSSQIQWLTGIAPKRSGGVGRRWARALTLAAFTGGLLIAGFGLTAAPALAASTTSVNLGQASSYAVLSGASVGNTVSAPGAPYTTLRGDLGVMADAQPTGFPPGVVTGTTVVGTPVTQAYDDLVTAYNGVAGRSGGTVIAGDLSGTTFAPGLYSAAGAVANTGTITLDGGGDPNAVFVFQIGGALNLAAGATVVLTDGAQASNVFWQVNGAAAVGAGATFTGTIMALNAIAIGAGSEVNGRALALNGAVSLNSDEFYSAPPVLAIAGGASTIGNNPDPVISGTTDLAAPGIVTVTVAGQTLTATPANGAWSVAPGLLANGTYTVVASVVDGAGNPGSATQQLTVDTVAPIVTITGGATATTNAVIPTVAGTSNAAPGTIVTVSVAGQTLTTLVQANGTWNATAAPIGDGTWSVLASVPDPAGNVGSASQLLTIAPATATALPRVPTVVPAVPHLMVWLSATAYKTTHGRRVQVPFVLSAKAKVTLTVLHGKRVVAKLSVTRRGAGRASLTWNGKVKRGFAPRGAYRIMLRAISPAGASAHDAATLHIT